MLWIILAVVLTILMPFVSRMAYEAIKPEPRAEGGWSDSYEARSWRANRGTVQFAATVVTLFGGLFASILLNFHFDEKDRIPEDRYTTLYSMNDAIGTKGNFFLGSGTINTSPVYTYYWQDGNQFRLAWVDASEAYITYSDNTPTLVHHGSKQRYSNWLSIGEDDWRVDVYNSDPYEFQIPKGSILQQYSLDAQ